METPTRRSKLAGSLALIEKAYFPLVLDGSSPFREISKHWRSSERPDAFLDLAYYTCDYLITLMGRETPVRIVGSYCPSQEWSDDLCARLRVLSIDAICALLFVWQGTKRNADGIVYKDLGRTSRRNDAMYRNLYQARIFLARYVEGEYEVEANIAAAMVLLSRVVTIASSTNGWKKNKRMRLLISEELARDPKADLTAAPLFVTPGRLPLYSKTPGGLLPEVLGYVDSSDEGKGKLTFPNKALIALENERDQEPSVLDLLDSE